MEGSSEALGSYSGEIHDDQSIVCASAVCGNMCSMHGCCPSKQSFGTQLTISDGYKSFNVDGYCKRLTI